VDPAGRVQSHPPRFRPSESLVKTLTIIEFHSHQSILKFGSVSRQIPNYLVFPDYTFTQYVVIKGCMGSMGPGGLQLYWTVGHERAGSGNIA
jgi:hypothetical protein